MKEEAPGAAPSKPQEPGTSPKKETKPKRKRSKSRETKDPVERQLDDFANDKDGIKPNKDEELLTRDEEIRQNGLYCLPTRQWRKNQARKAQYRAAQVGKVFLTQMETQARLQKMQMPRARQRRVRFAPDGQSPQERS